MPFYNPGTNNAYIPELNGLVAALIRNPNKFKINEYVQFRPTDKEIGVYAKIDNSESARVVTLDEYQWADGADRPMHTDGNVGFKFPTYKTIRFDTGFVLTNKTIMQASFDVQAVHIASHLQKMMTLQTHDIINSLENTANWSDSDLNVNHAATATALGGGPWASATSTNLNIRKSLNKAEENIIRDTHGLIDQSQLYLVLSPGLANTIANTSEIQDYVKANPFALAQIRGDQYTDSKGNVRKGRNRMFGLPDQLYGYELVVEDAVRVSSRKGSAITRGFLKSNDSAIILSKQDILPGDLAGSESSTMNFSTFQVYYWGGEGEATQTVQGMNTLDTEMGGLLTVEFFNDIRNRRLEGHVTGNWAKVFVAPESGYLIDVTG